MKILLDTHVFLWYITANIQLPVSFRDAIRDPANDIYLSSASIWEAVIKHMLGKLPLPEGPATYFPRQRNAHQILSLPIEEAAFVLLVGLPLFHKDPFDRILIAQAIQHKMMLASVDDAVRGYPVPLLPLS